MTRLHRWVANAAAALALLGTAGCMTTASIVLGAAGAASDTSVSWEIVKHLHRKLTEGDAQPCVLLDSVERALNPRCGEFVAGSLNSKGIDRSTLGECPLSIAAREPRLWPVLPELIARGALPEACAQPPLVELAQANDCPDLAGVPADVKRSLKWLAQADARAIHHDVVRWLSCPNSRAAGLDSTLAEWRDAGALQRGTLAFSPLGALHPGYIDSPFARILEADGHTAAEALGGFVGQRAPGFDEALRTSDWAALAWWLARQPTLANRVPATQGNQLAWQPLARVLVPSFLAHPESRADMVAFLMARGADPWQRLPSNPSQSIVGMARALKSPLVDTLAGAPASEPSARVLAANKRTPSDAAE